MRLKRSRQCSQACRWDALGEYHEGEVDAAVSPRRMRTGGAAPGRGEGRERTVDRTVTHRPVISC